ncbi:hypothetical protein [Clostridium sp.]|uniref:hypothetical protein n=1 Tax=Clostridium sp. TaxID=1506 RepID=UPI0025C1EE87|nr:hypothetical protein [Clostridium sp.]
MQVSTLFKENGHLTKVSINMLKEGSLSEVELILIAEHMSLCAECAGDFTDSLSDNELACVPSGFEQEILSKVKKNKERNTQFIFYSLRVAIAASIALVFVFSSQLNFIANTKTNTLNVSPISLSSINTVNQSLNDFSEKIINMEVFNNEKSKK